MLAELGVFFLIIALLASSLQAAFLWPRLRNTLAPCLLPAAWMQSLAITLAFAMLVALRINSDFSVGNVVAHSNLSLPLLYKIAGTWGNHEGSMLLWVWVLALFGLLLAIKNPLPTPLPHAGEGSASEARAGEGIKYSALAVQSLLCAGFLLFILFTSNPFARIFPPVADGETLNPLLQDIALAMHPPLLYIGYVGFSIVFSLSVALLLAPLPLLGGRPGRGLQSTIDKNNPHLNPPPKRGGDFMQDWAYAAHPWILASWSALTVGIGLGSWWAYRELGWGGWWFWDPVENASLLPWLSGTALLHSNIVLKKRGLLPAWVLLLSILTFGLSLLGTFLVRSGVLTSVHGFASDPARGLFILIYIVIAVGGGLLLFGLRAGKLSSPGGMRPVSRDGLIVVNNLFLMTACATVLLGTLYPLLAEALGGRMLTVGPPYFNATFIPIMVAPLIFAGLAPLMPWKTASFKQALIDASPALLAVLVVILLVMAAVQSDLALALLGFGLAAWLGASSLQWLRRAQGVKGAWSVFISHLGVAVIVAGITGVGLWKKEIDQWMAAGDILDMAGYELLWQPSAPARGPNYDSYGGTFTVTRDNKKITELAPEYRAYDIVRSVTSEAAIYSTWAGDLYAVVGERSADGERTAARIYHVPMIRFIWLGFVLMAIGGLIAIKERRHGKLTV